jgi:hypothetical protein
MNFMGPHMVNLLKFMVVVFETLENLELCCQQNNWQLLFGFVACF